MLTKGFNHVAVLTADTGRFHDFYRGVFDAEVLEPFDAAPEGADIRLSMVVIGDNVEFNVFEIPDNDEPARQVPMFGRGRLDHLALAAASLEDFEEIRARLMARGASDGFVTDFGPILSVFFRDPDGLECEVCVENSDGESGIFHPPGTPAPRYHGPGS